MEEPKVTIGCQPKWYLTKDGKMIENPDYVEPEVNDEPDDESFDRQPGTVRFDLINRRSYLITDDGEQEISPGSTVIYRTMQTQFDVCVTRKVFEENQDGKCSVRFIHSLTDPVACVVLRPHYPKEENQWLNNWYLWSDKPRELGDYKWNPLDVEIVDSGSFVCKWLPLASEYIAYAFTEEGITAAESAIKCGFSMAFKKDTFSQPDHVVVKHLVDTAR
jgi:hypothetical protein